MGFSTKDDLRDLAKEPGREIIKENLNLYINKFMPFQKKVTIKVADLIALGAVSTGQITGFELPVGAEVTSAFANVTEALAGGTVTAATVSLGPTATWDTLLTAGNCFATGLLTARGTDLDGSVTAVYSMSADTDLKLEFVLTGDTFDNLTDGEVDVYIDYIEHANYNAEALP